MGCPTTDDTTGGDPSTGLDPTTTSTSTGLPDATNTYGGAAMERAYGLDVADIGDQSALDIVRVAGFGSQCAIEVFFR